MEKNINKKGVPTKGCLSIIINYSLRAINITSNKGNESNGKEKKEERMTDKTEENLIEKDEDNYFGLNLFLNYPL